MSMLLAVDRVTKRYGHVTVADGLSLEVAAGEAVGVVGPNGAGKTSLFALIAGEQAPDSGTLALDGRALNGLSAAARCRLGIGRTYQVPRPFTHLTVFENALLAAQQGAGLRGRNAYTAAAEVLATTGLAGVANRPAGTLTLLRRKRLELARALATGPRLLLLDEVAGGLTDPEVHELMEIIRRVHADGVAVVWIEHVVRALTGTVRRLVCLAGGAIVADGPPAEVLASPAVREVYLGGSLELAGTDT